MLLNIIFLPTVIKKLDNHTYIGPPVERSLKHFCHFYPASVTVRLELILFPGAMMQTMFGSQGGQHASSSFLSTTAGAPGVLTKPKVKQPFGIVT